MQLGLVQLLPAVIKATNNNGATANIYHAFSLCKIIVINFIV